MQKKEPIPYYNMPGCEPFPQIELEFQIQGANTRFCIIGFQGDNLKEILVDSPEWDYEILGRLNEIPQRLAQVLMLELSHQGWPRKTFPIPWVMLMKGKVKKIILPSQGFLRNS